MNSSDHDILPVKASQHGARAVVVNRTHRVVREQALTMQKQKQKSRSLWVPLVFFSGLMLTIGYGIWAILFLLWSLPVTAVVLGLVWFKRGRGLSGGEVQQ